MGLFGKPQTKTKNKLKESATINTKYIYEICKIIEGSAGLLTDLAKVDEYYVEPAKKAMEILNKSVDITGKSISALKEWEITKSAPMIEANKARINELNDEINQILRAAKEEN